LRDKQREQRPRTSKRYGALPSSSG
jgi:hypothetical protein